MKILHVMMGLERGGSRTFMFALACESVRRGHDVHVAAFHDAIVANQAQALNLPFHLARRGTKIDPVGPMLRARRLFRRLRPDIVHTHTYFPHIVARPAARSAGVPVVVSSIQTNLARGRGLSGKGIPLRNKLVPKLVSMTDRFADRLFVVSLDIEEEYARRNVSPEKVVCVPNGVQVDKFASGADRNGVRRELGIEPDARVIGTACTLIPRKRVDLIVRLAKTLAPKVPDITVLIVGDGPERSSLEALAEKLGVAAKTRFLGARDDVHRILPAMDIFLLPSMMEGTSLALMEAMASGRACVATAIGGTPEIITDGESGLLVHPGDGPSLADAVLRLIEDDRLRESIARRGQQRVRQDYDVMKSVDTILQSCQQLLADRGKKESS
jgi:glycosyltransferase involved in cell wall biosynthesis